ncbi:MAG TPA: hypothetical protein VKZ50_03495 [bacterium]|nr:hypothetical protein [bacterium]
MKQFQVLTIVLLTAITFELGTILVNLPTPDAHAAPLAPAPAAQGPAYALDKDLTDISTRLGNIESKLTALQQAQTVLQQTQVNMFSKENDDSKRLLMTCFMIAQMYLNGPVGQGKNPLDSCTAHGWSASSFGNFSIPFGP